MTEAAMNALFEEVERVKHERDRLLEENKGLRAGLTRLVRSIKEGDRVERVEALDAALTALTETPEREE